MKKIIKVYFLLFIFFQIQCKNNAVCIVPIADIVSHSFQELNPNSDILQEYKNLPISGEKGFLNCPRIHQLLFNEQVEILQELMHEVKIKVNNTFLQAADNSQKEFIFYTLKRNLISLDQLNSNYLPYQIDLSTNFDAPKKNTITLILPFHEKQTNNIFSIGTRFIYNNFIDDNYEVKIFDYKTNMYVETVIPKNIIFKEQWMNINERINTFIRLLKLWTSFDRYIPYVWGGCSCTNFIVDRKIELIHGKNCLGNKILFYKRNNISNRPYSGFDCSSLILRAAQIAQLPYFFKNTTTLEKNLKTLKSADEIENGDLVWFPGHVLIISDIKNNLFIEARGYNSGYGRIHQIPFNKFFKNINNVKDLKSAYLNKKELNVINKQGNSNYLKIKEIKILKLRSLFY